MTKFQPPTLFGRFGLASAVMHTLRTRFQHQLGLRSNDCQYRHVPTGRSATKLFLLLWGTAAFLLGLAGCAKKRDPLREALKGAPFDVAGEARRLGLTWEPENAFTKLGSSTPIDVRVRTAHGLLLSLSGARHSAASNGGPRIQVENARAVLKGSLATVFDDWRSLASGLGVPVQIARADIEFHDRLWSQIELNGVSLEPVPAGYAVHAKQVIVGPKHWKDVTFNVKKPKSALLIHFGGREPGSRQWELRYVPTPGVATEWILDVPSQPLKTLELAGSSTLPCTRANGVLSLIVPENPQIKMRGRFQSVADECQAPDWPESSALFGGTVSLMFAIEPSDDHQSWNLRSVNFTSAMFELTGTGKLILQEEPELSWEISGSRTCAQLEANLAASQALERVKGFLRVARDLASAKQARVSLSMHGRVRANPSLEREVAWRLNGNCGIADAGAP